jgi:hypothetical protein
VSLAGNLVARGNTGGDGLGGGVDAAHGSTDAQTLISGNHASTQ